MSPVIERAKATSLPPEPSGVSEELSGGARVPNASLQAPGLTVLYR